ncbi:DUF2884 domain-containing protein [Microbulbifer flavimaris]|uniref:DUF2884 domain-containing protein n=1 Tax=Microbulbifer flavimaris TaxID=1781068 RepID=A0ABX4I1W5_9GAMM|nr:MULTISPECIES: DUF2884 family protein [Microbulbifer]KUJ83740.1 hypothetical protein AVO43_07870 [Microbulbifer sp. ZGT114]PCO05912.1 DUF2884 domain-containing protein [Microbulbifer flavimaris]
MWKPLLMAAALSASGAVSADNLQFGSDESDNCNIDIQHTVRLGPSFIDVRESTDAPDVLFHYEVPGALLVDGETIALNDEQQALMARYYGQMHEASRNLSLISLLAVDVALHGVSIALTTLAGLDHPNAEELRLTMAEVEKRAYQRFSEQDGVYTLGTDGVEDFVEETIGEDLEPRLEKIAMDSAGTIAWNALKAALTGGRSIEAQAEQAAEAAEGAIEEKAEALEAMTDSLCRQMEAIDQTETEVHAAIPQLANYDLIQLD